MINVNRLPALQDAGLVKRKADCGASGAASLSSLLDKVLQEHVSAVPSRSEIVAQKQQQAAAAAKASQRLQPLNKQPRVDQIVARQQGKDTAAAGGGRGVSRLAHIREDAEDDADEWRGGTLSLQHYDGVTIKSRTHSRQGIVG